MTRTTDSSEEVQQEAHDEVTRLFEDAIGVPSIQTKLENIGNQTFVKFMVGRRANVYDHAIRRTQISLPDDHLFKGLLLLDYEKPAKFPASLEATVLASLLTRLTRHVVEEQSADRINLSFVPFQNNADDKVIQPASHVIVGRRGVGKSTLIARATQRLQNTRHMCIVLDMQAYANSTEETIFYDAIGDITQRLADAADQRIETNLSLPVQELSDLANKLLDEEIRIERIGPTLRRLVEKLTTPLQANIFVFLDDFHVIDGRIQPKLLHLLHGAFKGAGGWLKVAGLRSLLNVYDAKTQQGLQVPGDAQWVSLDVTLVDPQRAEQHLQAILLRFLDLIGVTSTTSIIPDKALRRLVWASAGVPRDFLEMIGRSLAHARRSKHPHITLTDANLAIGEFGQRKLDYMEQDARNEEQRLRKVVDYLKKFCLDEEKINAFLVRSEDGPERETIHILSDLRIVHLIHPTITPHKVGERYEAFLVDYSIFTGFRRRPNIREMLPEDGRQFKATELRKIPTLPRGFLQEIEQPG